MPFLQLVTSHSAGNHFSSHRQALLVRTRTGEGALVNYRLRRPYYVVDTLFETALMVMGVGTHQERVTIRRLGPPTLGGGQ